MGKKGHRSRRGKGEIYSEPKAFRQMILLTQTGRDILRGLSRDRAASYSQIIEELLREAGGDHGVFTEKLKP